MVSAPAGCSRVSVALLCGLALCFVLAVEVGLLLYGDLAKVRAAEGGLPSRDQTPGRALSAPRCCVQLWQVRQGPLGVMGVRHREPTGPGDALRVAGGKRTGLRAGAAARVAAARPLAAA